MKLFGVSSFLRIREKTSSQISLVLVVILVESSNLKVSSRYFVWWPLVGQQRSLKNAWRGTHQKCISISGWQINSIKGTMFFASTRCKVKQFVDFGGTERIVSSPCHIAWSVVSICSFYAGGSPQVFRIDNLQVASGSTRIVNYCCIVCILREIIQNS